MFGNYSAVTYKETISTRELTLENSLRNVLVTRDDVAMETGSAINVLRNGTKTHRNRQKTKAAGAG